MSDIAQLQKEARQAEREKWILIVQAMANDARRKPVFCDEDAGYNNGAVSTFRAVLGALEAAQEAKQ